ncbi:MAG: hypothetical protein RL180_1738 [Pseudomonadota bacterium]
MVDCLVAQADINWSAPWCLPMLRSLAADHIAQAPDCLAALNTAALDLPARPVTGLGQTLCFVAQDALPAGMAYESLIAETGHIPTRTNLHDFFNACIWLMFPRSKAVLNRLQYQQIAQHGVQAQRGGVRDAITVFDENGAILVTCRPELGHALQQFDWQHSLVKPRALWDHPQHPSGDAQAAVYLFGHALFEQLVKPRKNLCAHTWVIEVEPDWFAQDTATQLADLDGRLAEQWATLALYPRMFQPLPVLGVPHFWPDNADPLFYADTQVFRAGRRNNTHDTR